MSTEIPQPEVEPGRLQILATEHWSLLATRALTYNESLSRVSMFLSILSGAVIALALIAQADHFGQTFDLIAILLLAVVLFFGAVTVVRLGVLNNDDLRWVMGMNRLRHAYLEQHPDLEPYFISSRFDDFHGVAVTLGFTEAEGRGVPGLLHGFQTLPGTVGVITAVVGGSLGALIVHALGAPSSAVVGVAVAMFLLTILVLAAAGLRSFRRLRASVVPRFGGSS